MTLKNFDLKKWVLRENPDIELVETQENRSEEKMKIAELLQKGARGTFLDNQELLILKKIFEQVDDKLIVYCQEKLHDGLREDEKKSNKLSSLFGIIATVFTTPKLSKYLLEYLNLRF